MSDDTIFFGLLGALVVIAIILWILHSIILSASHGKKLWIESRKQNEHLARTVRLLSELLQRQGVPKETVDEITDLGKPYFK